MSKNKKRTETEEEILDQEQVQNPVEDTEKAEKESDAQEERKEISEIEQVQEDLKKEKDRYVRLFAEFENFKRRTAKERIDLFKSAVQEVIMAMLPVLDDFDRALSE